MNIQFRLIDICKQNIVGYCKWYSGKLDSKNFWEAKPCWLYSEDGKYWNPKKIEHRYKDRVAGRYSEGCILKFIFENDIIEGVISINGLPTIGIVTWDVDHCCWANRNEAGLTMLYKIDSITIKSNIYDDPKFKG